MEYSNESVLRVTGNDINVNKKYALKKKALPRTVKRPSKDSTDNTLYKTLSDFYTVSVMGSELTAEKKMLTQVLRERYDEAIESAVVGNYVALDKIGALTLVMRKMHPRLLFDKNKFIKAVAKKYDLSFTELTAIAETSTKPSSVSVFLEVNFANDIDI